MDRYMQEERDLDPDFDKECARSDLIISLTEDILLYMESRKINIQDLSKKSGVKVRRLKKILNEYGNFSLNELADICHVLKLDPFKLILVKDIK